jgi:hypothetical protein
MPPAANGLRNLVGRFLNNPGTLVNMLRIEPGRDGRFEVDCARIARYFLNIGVRRRKRDPCHHLQCSSFRERKRELQVYVVFSPLFSYRLVCRCLRVLSCTGCSLFKSYSCVVAMFSQYIYYRDFNAASDMWEEMGLFGNQR